METVLEVDAVVTRFGADPPRRRQLRGRRGEVVALIGGSGTGKSVLLKEMIGLLRPASVSIRLLGTDVWQPTEAR